MLSFYEIFNELPFKDIRLLKTNEYDSVLGDHQGTPLVNDDTGLMRASVEHVLRTWLEQK